MKPSLRHFLISLWVVSESALSQDLLACSPGKEVQTALAVCAVARGGCALASRLASDDSQRRFLVSESCTALASSITGEAYNVADFLGSAVTTAIDQASRTALQDNNPDNDWIARVGQVAVALYQVATFAQCVDVAMARCTARWQASSAASALANVKLEEIVRSTVYRHFAQDTKCQIDLSLKHYSDTVFYGDKQLDRQQLRRLKELDCARVIPSRDLTIRDQRVVVTDFPPDSRIKIADFDVDLEQAGVTSTTHVRLALRTDTGTPLIIGAFQTEWEAEQEARAVPARLASLSCWSRCPYFSDLLEKAPELRVQILRSLSESRVEQTDWLFAGVQGPLQPLLVGSSKYYLMSVCQPHNCPHRYAFVLTAGTNRIVGRYVDDDANARWIGKPDSAERAILASD